VFEGEAITQRMHTDCEEVTHGWREDDWENRDEHEFREEMGKRHLEQTPPEKGSAL
jgi:hypothetical protein